MLTLALNRRWAAFTSVGPYFLMMILMAPISAGAASLVRLHGTLVAQPCILVAEDENQEIAFGGIINNFLYHHTRTESRGLAFHLTECNVKTIKGVRIIFSGNENSDLPGLLAVTGVSGIAIGLEDADGHPLAVNTLSRSWPITTQEKTLKLMAYVRAEPDAIAHRSITPGRFSAIATFRLEYQ